MMASVIVETSRTGSSSSIGYMLNNSEIPSTVRDIIQRHNVNILRIGAQHPQQPQLFLVPVDTEGRRYMTCTEISETQDSYYTFTAEELANLQEMIANSPSVKSRL